MPIRFVSPVFFLPNTTTLLARSAINLLRSANQATLDEAITTIQNRRLAASDVMKQLEQHVRFGEVLEKLAKEWLPDTQRAFATAFNMDASKTEVMDLIVAVAILNEDDLETELRSENTPEATGAELLENRRITWQYPPPGTPLDPPYLVLVAVEHLDTAKADQEIQSILGELVDHKGFKIPRRITAQQRTFQPELLPQLTEVLKVAPAIQPSPKPIPIPLTVPFSRAASAFAAQQPQAATGFTAQTAQTATKPAAQPAQGAAKPAATPAQSAAKTTAPASPESTLQKAIVQTSRISGRR